MLKSHAEAWHVYNDTYRKTHGGKVGIALNSDWAEPKNQSSPDDQAAADRYLQSMLGWFAHPVFVDGDYPAALKAQIEKKRTECPLSEPARLPVFTPEESQRIRGTADFFGLTHYTSRLVESSEGGCSPGPQGVGDFQASVDPSWPPTASDWIFSAPWGLRRLLNYISTEYLNTRKVPIHITGNGMPAEDNLDTFNDTNRIEYMKGYINEALKGKHEQYFKQLLVFTLSHETLNFSLMCLCVLQLFSQTAWMCNDLLCSRSWTDLRETTATAKDLVFITSTLRTLRDREPQDSQLTSTLRSSNKMALSHTKLTSSQFQGSTFPSEQIFYHLRRFHLVQRLCGRNSHTRQISRGSFTTMVLSQKDSVGECHPRPTRSKADGMLMGRDQASGILLLRNLETLITMKMGMWLVIVITDWKKTSTCCEL